MDKSFSVKAIASKGMTDLRKYFSKSCATQSVKKLSVLNLKASRFFVMFEQIFLMILISLMNLN